MKNILKFLYILIHWEELEINRFIGSVRSGSIVSEGVRKWLSLGTWYWEKSTDKRSSWPFDGAVSGWQLGRDCWEKDTLMTTRAARDAPSQLGSLWHLARFSSLRMLNAHTPASNFKSKSLADLKWYNKQYIYFFSWPVFFSCLFIEDLSKN